MKTKHKIVDDFPGNVDLKPYHDIITRWVIDPSTIPRFRDSVFNEKYLDLFGFRYFLRLESAADYDGRFLYLFSNKDQGVLDKYYENGYLSQYASDLIQNYLMRYKLTKKDVEHLTRPDIEFLLAENAYERAQLLYWLAKYNHPDCPLSAQLAFQENNP